MSSGTTYAAALLLNLFNQECVYIYKIKETKIVRGDAFIISSKVESTKQPSIGRLVSLLELFMRRLGTVLNLFNQS